MAKAAEKDPINFVHQNAILCETILKETRNQKLYTNYSVNPFKKIHNLSGKPNSLHDSEEGEEDVHNLSGKPNSLHDSEEGEEDVHFKEVIKRAHQEPVKKYVRPQTEAQEIGWITKPLIDSDRGDRRLNYPRQNSAITKYMDAAWRVKEQTENLN